MTRVDGNASVDAALNGDYDPLAKYTRWHNAPIAIDIPIGQEGEEVEINLQDLEDPTELCQLLENERADRKYWVTVALAYARQSQLDYALDVLQKGLQVLARSGPKDRLTILGCMSWIYLLKSRQAPRTVGEGQDPAEVRTKEHHLREATNVMNEATRINPAYPPLYLTRGVLNLLRASLITATKTGPGAEAERTDALNQALKSFEEAAKFSDQRNLLALMGQARSLYLLKKYSPALATYQKVMAKMPDLTDPDPRIGIGACMWQLGHRDNARSAWERALRLNPKSTVAHTLLGISYLHESSKYPADDGKFGLLYSKGMANHIQAGYAMDKQHALASAVFSTYFLNTKRFDKMEPLAKKAIEQTDVNAIASDGWFVRARKEHECGNFQLANDAYNRADQARGGQNAGYFPAKFGQVQLMIASGDVQGAKFRLEKLLETKKALEIMTLLGCIYAEEIFAAQKVNPKDDKTNDIRKAIRMLEAVRKNWKDEKAKVKTRPDPAVLLYLARLYETDNPLESEKCLAEVENIQRQVIGSDGQFDPNSEDFNEMIQEQMPPQLHNNIGCFYYKDEAYEQALQRFEIALNATLKLHEKQAEERQKLQESEGAAADLDFTDTDALVTTISYNLARVQEALGQRDEAIRTYEGLLTKRHPDYTDASARLAYIALVESPQDQGPKKMKAMYDTDYGHPEVRALMGWYFHSSKKKTTNIAEDQEFRHHKHTLQGYDKHDVYALVAMGNVHLSIARDMPRNSDSEKEKRSKMYQKAYEFFDKALQLDPRNAYAAQGIAVALCDDKKNFSEALQILVKVKDTIRETSVFQNLGHVYCETKQYARSIENYETALKKQIQAREARINQQKAVNGDPGLNGINGSAKVDHKEDAQLLASLARVWLLRGKNDKSILSHTTSLELMKRALATQPDSPHLRFNVAFIQFQIVQLVNSLTETARTLEDLTSAKAGLEEAITTFEEVAAVPQPPYPRTILEQRAAMSKGTMMKQLDRALQQQADYERANQEKLEEAKKKRAEELRLRDAAARRRQEEEEAREAEVRKKREQFMEEAAAKAEEFRQAALIREAADYTTDEEGARVKRVKKKGGAGGTRGKKRKQRDDEDGFIEHDEDDGDTDASHGGARDRTPLSGSDEEAQRDKRPPKKKKRLERKAPRAPKPPAKKGKEGKFKSQPVVVDSDDSAEEEEAAETPASGSGMDRSRSVSAAAADVPTPGGAGDIAEDADGDGDGDADGDVSMRDQQTSKPRPSAPRQRKQLRTIADDEDDDEEDAAPAPSSSGHKSASRVVDDDDDEE